MCTHISRGTARFKNGPVCRMYTSEELAVSVRFRFAGRSGDPGAALSLKSGYVDCVRRSHPDINPSLSSTASRPLRLELRIFYLLLSTVAAADMAAERLQQ